MVKQEVGMPGFFIKAGFVEIIVIIAMSNIVLRSQGYYSSPIC